jgi:hypothetical protein
MLRRSSRLWGQTAAAAGGEAGTDKTNKKVSGLPAACLVLVRRARYGSTGWSCSWLKQ